MSASRISPSPVGQRFGGSAIGATASGQQLSAAAQVAASNASQLGQIRYASTWPRGWMAAAVPQRVREFNMQASKAQMAQAYLAQLEPLLQTLQRHVQHHAKLPSAGSLARAQQALEAARACWRQRHTNTLGSLDEALHWSPSRPARKQMQLRGWSAQTLQAESDRDREMVTFCLMGREGAHGAWQAQSDRSASAAQFALASALAPLGIQLDQVDETAVTVSIDERWWPTVQSTWMVRGQGNRCPAGQWVPVSCTPAISAVAIAAWQINETSGTADLQSALATVLPRVQAVSQQVAQFLLAAGGSLVATEADQLQRMREFSQAFAQAGQAPAYAWVQTVVPAVRATSRLRVSRLLRMAMRQAQLQKD